VVYGTLLLIALGAVTTAFLTRSEVRLNVVRDRSVMARTVDQGAVENVYTLLLMNASDRVQSLNVVIDPASEVRLLTPSTVLLQPAQASTLTVTALMSSEVAALRAGEIIDIHFEVTDPDHLSLQRVRERSTFIVPR
jgi:polyferredoxin